MYTIKVPEPIKVKSMTPTGEMEADCTFYDFLNGAVFKDFRWSTGGHVSMIRLRNLKRDLEKLKPGDEWPVEDSDMGIIKQAIQNPMLGERAIAPDYWEQVLDFSVMIHEAKTDKENKSG
jgi:hypothetical protein